MLLNELSTMFPWPQTLERGAHEGLVRGRPPQECPGPGSQRPSEGCGLGRRELGAAACCLPSCSWLLVGATQCHLDTQSVPVRPHPGTVYGAVLVCSRQDSDAHRNLTAQVLLLGFLQYLFSKPKTTKPLTSIVQLIT